MVIDTSALVAIVTNELDAAIYREAVDRASRRLISAATLFEAAIVIESRKGAAGGQALDLAISRAEFKIEPVDTEQVELARHAYRTYGRGRHPAALDYGDCFSYALAKAKDEPLLFKGEDFAKTDMTNALDEQSNDDLRPDDDSGALP